MTMNVPTIRNNIIEVLSLISDEKEHFKYQKNVSIANVPAELFCQWFDDTYHPDDNMFKKSFTSQELKELKAFNDLYDKLSDGCDAKSLKEIHSHALWPKVLSKAKLVLEEIKK